MSTAVASLSERDTTDHYQQEPNEYLYGKDGTDIFSTKEPDIRPRSQKLPFDIIDLTQPREEIRQRWRGVIVSSNEEELTVQLEDLTNPENPNELIVLSRDEIDTKDQLLIEPGALFDWYIGYRQGQKYSRERFSTIRFRRLPPWTATEIKQAENLAEEYADFFLAD
ncbi:hypothetical protein GO003_007730 [Methylicorpusculum oleiharenae]|uniref:hypothetical protein n=1 Tax=Methylicorpusculum oleiharenae TaxID=1338687 RepID=UPI00135AAD92|nr:hypothetical protein [Methylicorpusculum oleiharenae]MCD2450272.1 hypothetical protein [Methylicorpusculum oleiharenae]